MTVTLPLYFDQVKESGILQDEGLTKKEKSRQEAMYEVLTSEKTYGASLDILFRQVCSACAL